MVVYFSLDLLKSLVYPPQSLLPQMYHDGVLVTELQQFCLNQWAIESFGWIDEARLEDIFNSISSLKRTQDDFYIFQ